MWPCRGMGSARDGGGFRVTERDVAMVAWVGRQRFAEAELVARRFGMDRRNTYRRLRGLVALGLLKHRRVFHGRPGVYWATRLGLATAGVRLPVAGVDIRTYEHDRLAVTVAVDLEREFGREAVRTERELRSHDARAAEPRYGIRRRSGRGGDQRGLHFPDLAVELERPLAVEIELTAKGRTRLDSIVGGYVRARHIAGVRYYLAAQARAGVERAIQRADASDLFDLHVIEAEETSW